MPRAGVISSALLATVGLVLAVAGRAAPTPFSTDPEYLIDSWQTQNGLPENSATAMVQTADGYLWVGTFGGLARFNGLEFKVVDGAQTPNLPGQSVVNLHLDRRGRLLMSTLRALGLRETDGRWRTFGPKDGWLGDFARTFAERPDGDVLITAFNGRIAEFDGERFAQLPAPSSNGDGCVGWAGPDGRWWTAQPAFVGQWDGSRWTAALPPSNRNPSHFSATPSSDGGFWVLDGDSLVKYVDGAEVRRLSLPTGAGNYWSAREDRRGDVWICSIKTGLFRVSPDGRVRHWTTENGLTADSLRFTFEDREGCIWVGTNGGGLMRFKPRRFHTLALGPKTSPLNVTSISARAAGGVWIASYGSGLLRAEDGRLIPAELPSDRPRIGYLQSVLEDRLGRLWMGEFGHGVRVLEKDVVREIPPGETGGLNPLAFFEDSRDRLWIYGGRSIAVHEAGSFRTFGPDQGLPKGGVHGFGEDAQKRIWTAHLDGVFIFDGTRFAPFLDPAGHALRGVTCFHTSGDGSVWMGAHGRGLLRWREGRLAAIGAEAGLPAATISGIVDDGRGFLWLTSERGVIRAPLAGLLAAAEAPGSPLRCHLLDTHDGLPGLEFSQARHPLGARDGAGRLWFPTLRGAAMIDPAAFTPDESPPPVAIEDLSCLLPAEPGRPERTLSMTAPFGTPVVLPAGSRRLEIRYAALSYAAPEKARFQTWLVGRDTGWVDMGGNRTAAMYDLPPRDYRLRVRAANGDGSWNEAGASLAFTVRPYYWQTTWFRLGGAALLVALGASGAWTAARLRTNRLREKLELQQQRTEMAHLSRVATLSQLSGSLAHEINQPLAIILSNAQAAQRLLDQNPPDLAEIREILHDIAEEDRRAGTVIQRLRSLLKRGETTLQPEPVNALIEDVLDLVHSDLISRGITVARDLCPVLPPINGDRIQLQQVLLNLVTNACDSMAAIAPQERLLRVSTSHENGTVTIRVSDQGCGLPPGDPERVFKAFFTTKKDGLGIGLALCRSIVEAHHGRLQAIPHAGAGASFVVELPAAPLA